MASKKRRGNGSRGQSPSVGAMNEALRRRRLQEKGDSSVEKPTSEDTKQADSNDTSVSSTEKVIKAKEAEDTVSTKTDVEKQPTADNADKTQVKKSTSVDKSKTFSKTTAEKPKNTRDKKSENKKNPNTPPYKPTKPKGVPGDPVASQYANLASNGKTETRIGIAVVLVIILIIGSIIGGVWWSKHKTAEKAAERASSATQTLKTIKTKPANITDDGAFDFVEGKVIPASDENNAKYKNLVKVDVYMDFNCPGCGSTERTLGSRYNELLASNEIMLRIHPIAFLNNVSTDKYSERSANAVMQVADQDPEHLLSYIQYLMQSDIQPQEGSDYKSVSDKDLQKYAKAAGVEVKDYSTLTNMKFSKYTKAITDFLTTRKNLVRPNADQFTTPIVMVNGKHLMFDTNSLLDEFNTAVSNAQKTAKVKASTK